MESAGTELGSGVRELLTRIAGGESLRPDEVGGAGEDASQAGLVEQDPKGHLTLTARGRHLVEG